VQPSTRSRVRRDELESIPKLWSPPRAVGAAKRFPLVETQTNSKSHKPVAFSISIDHRLNFFVDLVCFPWFLRSPLHNLRQPTRKVTCLNSQKSPPRAMQVKIYEEKNKWRGMLPRVTYQSFTLLKERQIENYYRKI
jgi:hypothetical protein